MQHVDHDDVGGAGVRERKALRVSHAIKPRRALDVGCHHFGEAPLEVTYAAADLDRETVATRTGNAVVEIVVDDAQHPLAFPDAAVIRELIGGGASHHIALMRMNANKTMRSSMKPCRKREICVSP